MISGELFTVAKIIDGKFIAKELRDELAKEILQCRKPPHLTVILIGEDPASQSYVRSKSKNCKKAGISTETLQFPASFSQEDLLKLLDKLNNDPDVNGILIQLPLPDHIDEKIVIEKIDPIKDVDGFHPVNVGKLTSGLEDTFYPCTPAGIVELLLHENYEISGKHVVVVGRSNIVGKPVGLLLLKKGSRGDATVTYCHSRTPNLPEITRQADILIAAVGRSEMITREMVKPDAIVIDVGMNRVDDQSRPKGYRLTGDVKFDEVSQIAKAITPVPGGVGPMTIIMLLKNTLKAYRMQNAQ